MDEAERDDQDRAASVGMRQRRNWRTRRQAAGLVELTAWVREADLMRAHALLEPLVEVAAADMVRHGRQGRTSPVVVEVRFSGVPPAVFRERLRQGWGLLFVEKLYLFVVLVSYICKVSVGECDA